MARKQSGEKQNCAPGTELAASWHEPITLRSNGMTRQSKSAVDFHDRIVLLIQAVIETFGAVLGPVLLEGRPVAHVGLAVVGNLLTPIRRL